MFRTFTLILTGLFLLLAPSQARADPALPEVGIEEVHAAMSTTPPPVIVDVRTHGEFTTGHLPGARNLPLSELGQRIDSLKAHQADTIYLVCEVGGRSAQATRMLLEAGYQRPVNVRGGTRAWRDAKKPLEEGGATPEK
ncbi:MAG: rhodanese-like domain-containing protein [Myxococcota bacterium]|jgi:rhodanese-related sulfurtransferase|nr:rhodanese-like domain-containing protein [Myxococcota bacterium]